MADAHVASMEQRANNMVAQRAEPALRLLHTIVTSLHEVNNSSYTMRHAPCRGTVCA